VKKVWVINSSPLIVLGKISQLSLLLKLAEEVVVPEGVAAEVGRGPDGDPARIWLEAEGSNFVRMVGEPDPTVATWDLGLGESHLLSWALLHKGCEAIVDDRAARNCARSLGIPVVGTLGVLLLAKRNALLPRIAPVLQQMSDSGFRIKSHVAAHLLRIADEG